MFATKNKMKITLNGQSFEVPIDMKVLTAFMTKVPPQVLPMQQSSQEQPAQLRTAHRRLEDDFFKQIHEDMKSFEPRVINRFEGLMGSGQEIPGREERILRAIIALHNRVRRIENLCNVKGSSVSQVPPEQQEAVQEVAKPTDKKVVEANPNLAEFVKVLMSNLKPIGQKQEEPKEVEKPKVERKPRKPRITVKAIKLTKPKKS